MICLHSYRDIKKNGTGPNNKNQNKFLEYIVIVYFHFYNFLKNEKSLFYFKSKIYFASSQRKLCDSGILFFIFKCQCVQSFAIFVKVYYGFQILEYIAIFQKCLYRYNFRKYCDMRLICFLNEEATGQG